MSVIKNGEVPSIGPTLQTGYTSSGFWHYGYLLIFKKIT